MRANGSTFREPGRADSCKEQWSNGLDYARPSFAAKFAGWVVTILLHDGHMIPSAHGHRPCIFRRLRLRKQERLELKCKDRYCFTFHRSIQVLLLVSNSLKCINS